MSHYTKLPHHAQYQKAKTVHDFTGVNFTREFFDMNLTAAKVSQILEISYAISQKQLVERKTFCDQICSFDTVLHISSTIFLEKNLS